MFLKINESANDLEYEFIYYTESSEKNARNTKFYYANKKTYKNINLVLKY